MNQKELLLAVVLLALIGVGVYVVVSATPSTSPHWVFEEEREGVLFRSTSADPKPLMDSFLQKKDWIIIIQFDGNAGMLDVYRTNTLTLLASVLSFNRHQPTIVAEVLNGKTVSYCYSNEGQLMENNRLSAEACAQAVNKPLAAKIRVLLPDSARAKPEVWMEENKFTVVPSTPASALYATRRLLDVLFEGNKEAIARINSVLNKVTA